jgi:hypothetical protein
MPARALYIVPCSLESCLAPWCLFGCGWVLAVVLAAAGSLAVVDFRVGLRVFWWSCCLSSGLAASAAGACQACKARRLEHYMHVPAPQCTPTMHAQTCGNDFTSTLGKHKKRQKTPSFSCCLIMPCNTSCALEAAECTCWHLLALAGAAHCQQNCTAAQLQSIRSDAVCRRAIKRYNHHHHQLCMAFECHFQVCVQP